MKVYINFPFLFEICFSSLHDTVISTTHEQRRGTLYDKKVQYPVVLYIRLAIQFTIAFEDDTSNAIFEEDVAFIKSSSRSAWFSSLLCMQCSQTSANSVRSVFFLQVI